MPNGKRTQEEIQSVLTAYADAWAQRDRDRWLSTFADDAVQEDPIGEGIRRGRGEIGSFWDQAFETFDSIRILVRAVHLVGSEAAMEWTISARSTGEVVDFDGVDVFTFTDAPLIASVRAYWHRENRHRSVISEH